MLKILKTLKTDGEIYTHVSLEPKGKYLLTRDKSDEFWDSYCDAVFNEEVICLAEKPNQFLPVLVDVDIRIPAEQQDCPDKLYTEEQLLGLVEMYQTVLRSIVDHCTEQTLYCFILEKNLRIENKNERTFYKQGFHLHFPWCFLDRTHQEIHLIPRVIQMLKENNIFSNLFSDPSVIIDKSCCKVNWLMYGSRKGKEFEPYLITKIVNSSQEEIDLTTAIGQYQILNTKEQVIDINTNLTYYIPRVLSVNSFTRNPDVIKELKRNIPSPLKEQLKKEYKQTTQYENTSVTENLEIATQLLPLLAQSRAENRNDWINVGWLLYNISDGNAEGFELWLSFSQRCEHQFNEDTCMLEWNRMNKKDLTIGTLRYFAKTDSPEEYKNFQKERSTRYIKSLEISHNDIAKALYEEYGDIYVCSSYVNKTWYEFKHHRWNQIEEGVFLREKISSSFVERYVDMAKELYDLMKDGSKAEQTMYSVKLKQINKMISNLKNSSYKNAVMKECCEVFYNPKFRDRINNNPFLIGFQNGVYDLKLNIFRPGKPEDYISTAMPINYIIFSEGDEKIMQIYSFLEQVFPDKSVRSYFLDVSSDIFQGGNPEKMIQFWTGKGNNGKTITQKMFEAMLGKLSIKVNTNLATGKKPNAGSAFPELSRAGDGIRLISMEEPDSDEMINIGIMKSLSGNDTIFARDLFEKGKDTREIHPMFKIIFACNKLPRIKGADKAFWNRAKVIPFESEFVSKNDAKPCSDKYEQQLLEKRFPMDKNFANKIPDLAEAFCWVLLQHRLSISNKRRDEPEKVRQASAEYQKQNDMYSQFERDYFIKVDRSVINFNDVYNAFKMWYRESYNNNSVPVKNDVLEQLIGLWGQPDNKGTNKIWIGFRMLTEDERNGVILLKPEEMIQY